MNDCRYPQDLHIHTTFSQYDSSVVPEQTPELIARVKHAAVLGISDHFEHFADNAYDRYVDKLRSLNMLIGTEVDGASSVGHAADLYFDYYIYHCYDRAADYRAVEKLLATNRPVIIAHPNALQTDLYRVPRECLVEINNRYIWHTDWWHSMVRTKAGFTTSLALTPINQAGLAKALPDARQQNLIFGRPYSGISWRQHLVVFANTLARGATGFTDRLVAEYSFCHHGVGGDLRWVGGDRARQIGALPLIESRADPTRAVRTIAVLPPLAVLTSVLRCAGSMRWT
nr:hypothetical protein [Gammaproteobacteria bacterium]